MGYEVHIVRRSDWNNLEETSNISIGEWLECVANDREMELTNGYESKIPGATTTFHEIPGFSIWIAHPDLNDGNKPWFNYGLGSISTKYPDELTIKKMIQMAEVLNARVQGDHEEFYDATYFEQLLQTNKNEIAYPFNKPWWKFW